jgi:hypothetical protein
VVDQQLGIVVVLKFSVKGDVKVAQAVVNEYGPAHTLESEGLH